MEEFNGSVDSTDKKLEPKCMRYILPAVWLPSNHQLVRLPSYSLTCPRDYRTYIYIYTYVYQCQLNVFPLSRDPLIFVGYD